MKIKPQLNQLRQLLFLLLAICPFLLIPRFVAAQEQPTDFCKISATRSRKLVSDKSFASAPLPSPIPLQVELLNPEAPPPPPGIITANTIPQDHIATPSLWWAQEQFDRFGGKLLTNWIAYQDEKRIDLVVSRQPWTLLDYLDRYSFVTQFGAVARDYQYNVRVFNDRAAPLGSYTCDYTQELPTCQLRLCDSLGLDSTPVNPQ
ncbi:MULTISPECIES: hypothetical protein [unclassified Coleofasciculus]|uniref:hypothetical protein n=1 Tax=unclassified Coleofasciculus TaxID=2692782 RepID=UPI00187EC4BC|nr:MULTISPECIES: hypothetical protein [unclassified Coleofasciculus]MBE9128990.1 hypothetical protein [Coleofasciculus sp. LEGE 07081]MBE9151723.1 hypothetical protein [Coleofasciculus sp. LEGE 07092]